MFAGVASVKKRSKLVSENTRDFKMVDLLSNALNTVKVAELKGKATCTAPSSNLVYSVLNCLKESGYLFSIEREERVVKVTVNGKVNNCGAVRPRFFVKSTDWEKFENRFLPSKGVGLLVVSTSQGVMTHVQAKQKAIGGTLLAFVY